MSDSTQFNRREMLRHILVLAGASTTASFSLGALATVAKGADTYLDGQAFSTLSAVADTIVPVTDTPGALAAEVPANFDALLLNWASPETRDMLVSALERIDAAANTATNKRFEELSAAERKAFLIDHEKAALQPAPHPPDAPKGGNPFMARSFVVDNGYKRLKELIVMLYYVSEIGMTQELVYEHVPGKWEPSIELTPGMRPFASPGLM